MLLQKSTTIKVEIMNINSVKLLSRSLHIKYNLNQLMSTGSAKERPFPKLKQPLQIEKSSEALSTSKKAEAQYAKILSACRSGGGEKGMHKHVAVNKKVLARDRIRRIMDEGAEFFEICPTAGLGLEYGNVPGAGTVCGIGAIRGHLVMISANDGSLKGGTYFPITVTKSIRAQEIAMENKIPCLYVVDSGGGFLPLQADLFPDVKHGGRSFRNQAVMSGLGIPQIAIVAGPCTAGGAYAPTMSEECIMVNRIGHVFLGGPPLVKAATGEVVSHEELGGAKLHTSVSGVADYFAKDEEESFAQVRDIVSGLNLESPREFNPLDDPPEYDINELDTIAGLDHISKEDVKAVIARIVDDSRFSEFKAPFGENLITGFAKICNQLVGICANSGSITGRDGQKGAHFLQLCDTRSIPVIFLQNNNGHVENLSSYESFKESAKFAHCSANCHVPKISLNIGGLGGPQDMVSMAGPSFGSRFHLSWPRARYSKNPLSSPSESENTDSAQYAASRCTIDGIILPKDSRAAIAKCLQITLLNHTPMGRIQQQNSVIRI